MDVDDIVKEIEQTLEWFCDRVVEPVPIDKKSKEKVFARMVNLGWLRQSEVETYNEITKED
jgi:poly-beta-hydroxyalkanoate depolymerase